MMLGVSGLMAASGDGAAAAESGGASGGSSEVGASTSLPGGGVDEFERSGGGGGNRWPRQETLALLKIRSDMDVAFRDSSLKGPLWDEVSRKLAELGFHRSAKKCKEKFENVFKYHKRTKDGRASKSDGKTYRFFDQLMALENAPSPPPPPPRPQPQPPSSASSLPMPSHSHISITVPSASPTPLSSLPPIQTSNNPINSSPFQPPPLQPPPAASNPPPTHTFQPSHPHLALNSTSSSSTSSDEDIQRRRGKKRKWKDFFQRLMKDVIHKQEELQKKFLDTLEKRERDRMAREESWRVQEMARMNREHEFLVQERSIAAAKDAAVIAFLQKVTEQNNLQIPISSNIASPQVAMQPQPPPKNPQPPQQTPPPLPPLQLSALSSPVPPPPKAVAAQPVASETPEKTLDTTKTDNGGGDNSLPASSSRWPKSEVQALINLRTSLDLKYQENGPKGPLWEEISAAMAKLGYNRSSKRCKEKWENINKYFKKVKESSKKRPEDSKTCPYFHQLDAIYKERAKSDGGGGAAFNQGYAINTEPIMARPEQQWPLPDQQNPAILPDQDHDNNECENNDHDEDDDGDDDEEEDEGGGYEIVTNKQPSSAANAAE